MKHTAEINDSRMQNLVHNLNENPRDIMELVKETYNRVMDPTESLIQSVNDVVKKIEPLAESLKEYKTAIKLNTEFLM